MESTNNISLGTPLNARNICDFRVQSPLGPVADVFLGVYMTVLSVIGFGLNIMVIVTLCKVSRSLTNLEKCLINMAFCGAIPSVTSYLFVAAACFLHEWPFGQEGCIRDGFTVFFFGMASIGNLTLISILRYIKMCHSSIDRMINPPALYVMIVLTYIYAASMSVPPLFKSNLFDLEPYKLSCSITWVDIPLAYFCILFIFGYFIPLFCMGYCYLRMVYYVRSAHHRNTHLKKRLDVYLTMVTSLLCFSFILGWTPYAVTSFYSSLGYQSLLNINLTPLPAMIAKSTTVTNPIIYYFMISRFRQEVSHICLGIFCCETNYIFINTIANKTSMLQINNNNNNTSRAIPTKGNSSKSKSANVKSNLSISGCQLEQSL